MTKFWNSSAFRLSLICGAMVVVSVMLISVALYLRTVGVLERNADEKILLISDRLATVANTENLTEVTRKIALALSDGVDSDTEIYFLGDPNGRKIAGNVNSVASLYPLEKIIDQHVIRDGHPSQGRLLIRRTHAGNYLVVGRDMSDLNDINTLIWKAIGVGGLLAIALSVGGMIFFRAQIEKKIWAIRHAAHEIETGDLRSRIQVSEDGDEFSRLSQDLNRMLDRIEHLMDGVRHVSNNVAHNIRTPLGRVRAHLDEALRGDSNKQQLRAAGESALQELDGLISLLGKLMQVAEAESEIRRQHFQTISMHEVLTDLIELYDAVAEEMEIGLQMQIDGAPTIFGDKELISCAIANLLDNAIKYAGKNATIHFHLIQKQQKVTLLVKDNGPGIAADEREKVLQRFYRLDHKQPGHGMGLSIVNAIVKLHGGCLSLEDAKPGLILRLDFPRNNT
ncbi:HAMP domain-containing protein [Undibacterium sp. CY7W]|uniref:histidine kinase n=1 Tax=Undibacterium rugosum TaxID=2762291 RepID=A0A923I3D4_9BURK|nr:HAMP domain-containing sensor histidine kinase [Undibacterium rugosum]MBC3937034.1 HAMP domain-containing protein [Undibacterium rugosum]